MSIINPLTNRLIKIDGPTFNKLLSIGYIFHNNNLIKKSQLYNCIISNEIFMIIMKYMNIKEILSFGLLNKKYNKMYTNIYILCRKKIY